MKSIRKVSSHLANTKIQPGVAASIGADRGVDSVVLTGREFMDQEILPEGFGLVLNVMALYFQVKVSKNFGGKKAHNE